MSGQRGPKAFEEESAEALGLTSLRAGMHEIGDYREARSTTFWVNSIWFLRILPFREQSGLITVASSEHRNGEFAWQRSVLRTTDAEGVRDVLDDPVAEILRSVDLLASAKSNIKDGISYQLTVNTLDTHATIQFSTPSSEPWRSLELAAMQLAEELVVSCESQKLDQFVRTWRRYCEQNR